MSFEQALQHSQSPSKLLLPQLQRYRWSVAQDLITDLNLDLDAVLSFRARASKAAGKSIRLLGELSAFQAEWLLEHGAQCIAAGADYKTGLRCGHEATGPVETALQCARKLQDRKLLQLLAKLQEDNHIFIECTCYSTQVLLNRRAHKCCSTEAVMPSIQHL